MYFDIKGNASHIEWRNILIEDIWHSVDSISEIDVMGTQLGTGNHTIWVRAVSSEGISAPVTVPLNIADAKSSPSEDSTSIPFSLVLSVSLMVALFRSRKI